MRVKALDDALSSISRGDPRLSNAMGNTAHACFHARDISAAHPLGADSRSTIVTGSSPAALHTPSAFIKQGSAQQILLQYRQLENICILYLGLGGVIMHSTVANTTTQWTCSRRAVLPEYEAQAFLRARASLEFRGPFIYKFAGRYTGMHKLERTLSSINVVRLLPVCIP